MKITEKLIRGIFNKYNHLFDYMPEIDYIFIGKKNDMNVPAALVGPIEGNYGLFINTNDYIFDKNNILPIVLHEMVHYYLLLKGKQSNGKEQHNDVFQKKAKEIEEKTNVCGVNIGIDDIHISLRYRKRHFNILVLNKNGEDNVYMSRIPDDMLNYWIEYLKKYIDELGFSNFILFTSNRSFFENIPDNKKSLDLNLLPIPNNDFKNYFSFS